MKARLIRPAFFYSGSLAKCSRDARLMFVGLIEMADDEGRLLAATKDINGQVFPHDLDVSNQDIERWLGELAEAESVVLYDVGEVRYAIIPNFGRHQNYGRKTPSKLPAPPSREVAATNGKGLGQLLPSFEEFWAVYPRKVSKARAERTFAKVVKAGADPGQIVAGAARLEADPNLPPAQFVPYPSTWLNDRGWENGPLPPRNDKGASTLQRSLAKAKALAEQGR